MKTGRLTRGRVRGDGVELAFGSWSGEGSPIVGIHGLTASHMNFVGIAEAGRRPLFAVDLRGRGDSDKPRGPYGLAQHARDVAAAMRARGLGPSVIIGHSMGAFVAAALAAEAPSLVSHLVFLDGGLVPEYPAAADLNGLIEVILAPILERLRLIHPTPAAYVDYWRRQPTFAGRDWGAWVEPYLEYDLGGAPPDLKPKALETAVRIDSFELTERAPLEDRLRQITSPVLVIRAATGMNRSQPPVITDAVMSAIQRLIPTVEQAVIADTTHYTIALGEPGASRVAALVERFTGSH